MRCYVGQCHCFVWNDLKCWDIKNMFSFVFKLTWSTFQGRKVTCLRLYGSFIKYCVCGWLLNCGHSCLPGGSSCCTGVFYKHLFDKSPNTCTVVGTGVLFSCGLLRHVFSHQIKLKHDLTTIKYYFKTKIRVRIRIVFIR